MRGGKSLPARNTQILPEPFRHFELKTALTPGGSATAHPQDWNGTAYVTDTAAAREFTVEDVRVIFRGRGKDLLADPLAGSMGKAVLRNGQWEIDELTPHALKLSVAVDDATDVASGDASFNVDTAVVMQPTGAIIVDHDPAADFTVYNVYADDLNDDAYITVEWNEATDHWEVANITCPT